MYNDEYNKLQRSIVSGEVWHWLQPGSGWDPRQFQSDGFVSDWSLPRQHLRPCQPWPCWQRMRRPSMETTASGSGNSDPMKGWSRGLRASSAIRSAILVPLTTLVFPMVAFGSFAGIPFCAAVLLYNLMCQCTPLNISSGSYADSNLEHWVRVIKIADPSCRIGLAAPLFWGALLLPGGAECATSCR